MSSQQSFFKISNWRRIVYSLLGIFYTIFAFWILLNPQLAIETMILIFALILLFIGFLRLLDSIFEPELPKYGKFFVFLMGILILVISLLILLNSSFGIAFLINLIAIGLFLQGCTRLVVGLVDQHYSKSLRNLLILISAISLFLGIYVLAGQDTSTTSLIILLSIGFLANGIGRIIVAISGFQSVEI